MKESEYSVFKRRLKSTTHHAIPPSHIELLEAFEPFLDELMGRVSGHSKVNIEELGAVGLVQVATNGWTKVVLRDPYSGAEKLRAIE